MIAFMPSVVSWIALSEEERAEIIEETAAFYTPLLPDGAGGTRIPKCRLWGEQAYLTRNGVTKYEDTA